MKQLLYKIKLNKYLNECFYAMLIDRREENIHPNRFLILVVFKEKNISDILKLTRISKDDMYLNPLPLVNYYGFALGKIKWEKIGELDVNIDLIKNWAFKSSHYPMFGDLERHLNLDWYINLNDNETAYNIKYNQKWSNLELEEVYSESNADFRIALEYCRINRIPYEKGIKDFNKDDFFFQHRMKELDLIVSATALVDIYQEIPDNKKGKCLELPFDIIIDKWVGLPKHEEENNEQEVKQEEETPSYFIVAEIVENLGPIEQGYRYEEELMEFLEEEGYGQVSGGGTGISTATGEIGYFEIEIMLYGDEVDKKIIEKIISKLEELGAPKGSSIYIEDTEEKIEFGIN